MGKSRKRSRSTPGSNYPYSSVRVAHIHVVRPRTRRTSDSGLFIGLFMDSSTPPYGSGGHLPRSPSLRRLSSASLKRLDFVRVYSSYCWSKAASVYQGTRQALVPSALDSSLRLVEDRVGRLSSPLLHRSEHILHTIDGTVDTALTVVHSVLTRKGLEEALSTRKQNHEAALSRAATARARFLHAVKNKGEEAGAFLKGLGGGKEAAAEAHKALAALFTAVTAALEASFAPNADTATVQVRTAWANLSATPPANALLESAQPGVEAAWRKCLETHDAVAASLAYTRALETADSVVQKVTKSLMYRTAVEKLYHPWISPYSDPLLDKVTHSPYYLSVVEHLRPSRGGSGAGVLTSSLASQPWRVVA